MTFPENTMRSILESAYWVFVCIRLCVSTAECSFFLLSLPPTRHNNDSDKRAWKWQQTWEFPEGVYYSFFILLFKIGLP